MILISTRKAQDLTYGVDAYDQKGPGQVSQGDVAMQELLGDNGYSGRLVMDAQLGDTAVNDSYLNPADTNFAPVLIVVSGSSGSADVPRTLDKGVPVMMGEHSCLVEDIPGTDGVVTRKFDISAGPPTLFMRIRALP